MATVESLSALTASSINPNAIGSKSSSKDKLNKAESAGLLSGLTKEETDFALAKYCGDEDAHKKSIINSRFYTAHVFSLKHWKSEKKKIIALADLAINESINPCKCKRCSGTRYKFNKPCNSCNATGFRQMSNRQMALSIGIDESTFRARWEERLSLVLDHFNEIDNKIKKQVYKNGVE